jgi:arylsulfatase
MKSLSRRNFLAGVAASAVATNAQGSRPPNIVFVLTDDQGYGDIACLGNPVIKTPNLDRLHGESARFTDYHVSPTCAPTRTALLSGRHEFKSGVTHTILERERMSLKSTTFTQVLKSVGYTTGIFGKWHLGDGEAYQPNHRGFDEVFIHGCGGIGQDYPGTCSDAPGNTYFNPAIRHNGVFERTQGYCTDVFFTQALKWIEEKSKADQPFFAYITTNAPHEPLMCPEEYQRMYKGKGLPEATEKYFGMVTNIDDNVGKLMNRLTDWGLDKNTILIFMTDNGGTGGVRVFNAGMRGAKGTPYQGGTRVPAFFRWTGKFQPGDRAQLTAHIDIFATVAELAGANIPNGLKLDGRSMVPLLKDARAAWQDRVLFTHTGRWPKGQAAGAKYNTCSLRTARYSMVNAGPARKWELYDIQTDPGEKMNIATQHPDVIQKLDTAYDQWWAEILPCLENEDAVPPEVAPYKQLYWEQYGGGPGKLPR